MSEEYNVNSQEWLTLAARNLKKLQEKGTVMHWADVEPLVKKVRLALDKYAESF